MLLRANGFFHARIGKGTIRDVFDDVFDDDHARHSIAPVFGDPRFGIEARHAGEPPAGAGADAAVGDQLMTRLQAPRDDSNSSAGWENEAPMA